MSQAKVCGEESDSDTDEEGEEIAIIHDIHDVHV